MIGPLPGYRPLNEWEARVNAMWIISQLEDEARECMRVVMSMQPHEERARANDRYNQCHRLAAGYRSMIREASA